MGGDSENEIAHLKRFFNVIHRAEFKGALPVCFLRLAGDKNNGRVSGDMPLFEFVADFKAY